MKTLLCAAALLVALLALPCPAAADPPPANDQLENLLQSEPINLANWKTWAPRLREWSGEHFDAARPAFDRAMVFVRQEQKRATKGNRLSLGKALDKDAVAWMVLAGSYLHLKSDLAPVPRARMVADAAQRSIQRNNQIARAHHYRAWGLREEQLIPHDKGGPASPNRGRLEEALREHQKARELDPRSKGLSARNVAYLAARVEKWDQAEAYFAEALAQEPGAVKLAIQVARAINNQTSPHYQRKNPSASLKPLVARFPNDGVLASHYALALRRDNQHAEAKAEVARARQLGTDPATIIGGNTVQDIEQGPRPSAPAPAQHGGLFGGILAFFATVGWWAMWFTIIYGTIMGLMCLGGMVLARYTRGPRAADLLGKPPEQLAACGQVTRTSHESRLTTFYGIALLLALVLFYLSLPFVLAGMLVVLLVVLVIMLFTARDHSASDVHGAMLRASGGGVMAVFKAIFPRVGSGSFGVRKDREDAPKLYAALADVARRVDTAPVDEVWISPGADFGVHQEGRGPFGVFGGRKRVLTLGLCVMHYLTVSELKAILAHEYAHFSHADTFWNRFLFQVTLSLRTAMREMARTGGWSTYVNPFYWFFWLYSKSYSLLAAGFSRSREFLADRMACTLYGADVFARSLRKVCTDGTHFELTVYDNIVRLLKAKKAYVNMYLAFRKHRDENLSEEERRKLHRQLLDDKPSVFASHPTFRERLEAAKQLPRATQTEDISSLQLFDSPEKIECEMTDFLTEVVARYMRL